jgi:hypothetical protein
MASRFSKVSSSSKPKAKFKRHQVHEVTTSLTESKLIASDLADAKRYAYRAKAVLVGEATVKPYEPIYLDGLPNGMSGYWTVLKVTHIFGGTTANYMLEVELGTDVLGDTNPDASTASDTRDVNAEIAGQKIEPSPSILVDYAFSVNNTQLYTPPIKSVNIKPTDTALTTDPTSPNLYQNDVPDFSAVKRTTAWSATKGNKIL